MKSSNSKLSALVAAFAMVVLVGISGGLAWWLWSQGMIARPAGDTNSAGMSDSVTAGNYRVQVQIEPDPPRVGKNRLTVTIYDKDGQAIVGAKVRAVAQMPAMGTMPPMNASAEISASAPGTYSGEFELRMSGEWPLAVDIDTEALGHGDLTFDMAIGRTGLSLATATPGELSHYTCSMHPSVKSATPGTCPICGMDLVPVSKKELQSGSIHLDARRRQLIGVTTGVVEERALSQTIRAAGRITYDETQPAARMVARDDWASGRRYERCRHV